MPPGVPYIVGNECAERFSYYGMRAILFVFMTQYLMTANGEPNHMTKAEGTEFTHLFFASAYFFPLIGAIIADVFWGKYNTIIRLSIIYCLGHVVLGLNDPHIVLAVINHLPVSQAMHDSLVTSGTRIGLAIGLGLIAIGSGGIKPCVSSNVGDQFTTLNQHLLTRVYYWFYFSINVGSAVSMLLIPKMLDYFGPKWGPHVAFGTPGLLMFIATFIFWLGRKKLVHAPPAGGSFLTEVFSRDGLLALANLIPIYVFIAIWWSLYDQSSSRWVDQAASMDLNFFGHLWDASQIQAVNPILVLGYIPLFTYVIYPQMNKVWNFTPMRRMSIGFFFAVVSFLIPAWVETQISAGLKPSIGWQILAYMFLMASEVLIYATGLEFSYTQSPKRMKSMIMSFFLATNSAGNLFTALVNYLIQNKDGTAKLEGARYYLFFAGLMFVAAIIFIFVAMAYKGKTHIQDAEEAPV